MTAEPDTVTGLDRQKISEIVTQVLADLVQRDTQTLRQDTRLFLDLGLTSMNALELIMLLTDKLGVELQRALTWQHLETLGTLTRFVTDQAGEH
jgi:acyl carrier protein